MKREEKFLRGPSPVGTTISKLRDCRKATWDIPCKNSEKKQIRAHKSWKSFYRALGFCNLGPRVAGREKQDHGIVGSSFRGKGESPGEVMEGEQPGTKERAAIF